MALAVDASGSGSYPTTGFGINWILLRQRTFSSYFLIAMTKQ